MFLNVVHSKTNVFTTMGTGKCMTGQWHLGFCELGSTEGARFEAPETMLGWGVGKGVHLQPEDGSGKGAVLQRRFFFQFFISKWAIFIQNVFCVQTKMGGITQCPKYATETAC